MTNCKETFEYYQRKKQEKKTNLQMLLEKLSNTNDAAKFICGHFECEACPAEHNGQCKGTKAIIDWLDEEVSNPDWF